MAGFPTGQYPDIEPEFHTIHDACRHATMTSVDRMYAMYKAVKHVARWVPGDIVECGVWQGGSMMCAALSLLHLGDTSRRLFLYDTYEGMTPPEPVDIDLSGAAASDIIERIRSISPLEQVKANMAATGYPNDRLVFVKGRVEETIPKIAPDKIAILRLDTDWYASTKHELVELYPRLVHGGVLIIDDYGHWQGARRAVDEYFHTAPILLHRIDYTGRIGVKIAP